MLKVSDMHVCSTYLAIENLEANKYLKTTLLQLNKKKYDNLVARVGYSIDLLFYFIQNRKQLWLKLKY